MAQNKIDFPKGGEKMITPTIFVATPLWGKCQDETHTSKSGNLESFRTPEILELDCNGQDTSP